MKKVLSIILVLCLSFAIGIGAVSAVAEEKTDYKIGIFLKDSTTAFWRYVVQGATEKADELGVTLVEYAPASYTDSAGQISMIEDAIQSGINAICIASIDSTATAPVLEAAEKAGIVVIVFNTKVPLFEATGLQRTFIGADNATASHLVANAAMADLNYQANVVILDGTPGTQMSADRCDPVLALADEHEGVKIIAREPCYANRETGMTVMENILQTYDDIDIVWGLNDPTALGALQAIEAAGRENILVVGIDGLPEAVAAIMNGRMAYTFDQAPFNMGALTVEAAVKALNGEKLEPVVFTGGDLIGINNAKDHLLKYYPTEGWVN